MKTKGKVHGNTGKKFKVTKSPYLVNGIIVMAISSKSAATTANGGRKTAWVGSFEDESMRFTLTYRSLTDHTNRFAVTR